MNFVGSYGISDLIEKFIKPDSTSNLGKKEKRALHKLVKEKNRIHVINDTDKNLGPANADKSDVIKECKRQLYDVDTYNKLSFEEMKLFLQKSIAALRRTVERHFYLGNCSQKEKEFLLSNVFNYAIPHFYIIWKILKSAQLFVVLKVHACPREQKIASLLDFHQLKLKM